MSRCWSTSMKVVKWLLRAQADLASQWAARTTPILSYLSCSAIADLHSLMNAATYVHLMTTLD